MVLQVHSFREYIFDREDMLELPPFGLDAQEEVVNN